MDEKARIVQVFLTFQVLLKIYHWQTKSFARHKASDTLYDNISAKIDRFVEALQGNRGRVELTGSISFQNFQTEDDGLDLLRRFETWLVESLPEMLDADGEKDLINLKDEMLNDIHQSLYLFTLN